MFGTLIFKLTKLVSKCPSYMFLIYMPTQYKRGYLEVCPRKMPHDMKLRNQK